jgi:hypothetical protein
LATDPLFRKAKATAAERAQSLKAFVTAALRDKLMRDSARVSAIEPGIACPARSSQCVAACNERLAQFITIAAPTNPCRRDPQATEFYFGHAIFAMSGFFTLPNELRTTKNTRAICVPSAYRPYGRTSSPPRIANRTVKNTDTEKTVPHKVQPKQP